MAGWSAGGDGLSKQLFFLMRFFPESNKNALDFPIYIRVQRCIQELDRWVQI